MVPIYQTSLYLFTLYYYSFGYPYMGCLKDFPDRVLSHIGPRLMNMTNTFCRNYCCSMASYIYFGTEVKPSKIVALTIDQMGTECYCGSNITRFEETPGECQDRCFGDRSTLCGDVWRISIYKALCPMMTRDSEQTTMQTRRISEKPDECLCECDENRKVQSGVLESIESKVANLKKRLLVNKRNTSIYRRTKMCSKDERLSSMSMGIVGIAIIVLPVVLAVINDALTYMYLK